MDNEITMSIESLKAQVNGWKECCQNWQDKAVKSEENIERLFEEIMDFVKDRCTVVEALASDSDIEEYYAGCFDTYCRVGGFINELKNKHIEKAVRGDGKVL